MSNSTCCITAYTYFTYFTYFTYNAINELSLYMAMVDRRSYSMLYTAWSTIAIEREREGLRERERLRERLTFLLTVVNLQDGRIQNAVYIQRVKFDHIAVYEPCRTSMSIIPHCGTFQHAPIKYKLVHNPDHGHH